MPILCFSLLPAALMMVARTDAAFRHEALLYAGDDDFQARVGAFLAAAVDAGEPALAVVDGRKIDGLRAFLGPRARQVHFADMSVLGRNPGRVIGAWRAFVAANEDAAALRGVGEPLGPDRSAAEREECHLHEALLNVALSDAGLWLICPYDTTSLAVDDLDRVGQSHPLVQHAGATRASETVVPAAELFDHSLPEPGRVDMEIDFDLETLRDVRAIVGLQAAAFGLDAEQIVALVLAASEIATNSVSYGGGRGKLRCWSDGAALVCELSDRGRIGEPLAGRIRPRPGQMSGYGLWVAQQLCDLVQIRSGAWGTVVRVRITRR